METLSHSVAITGPFADVNFGDYAMLVNNIYDLNISKALLFTYDKEFVNEIEGEYFRDHRIDTCEVILEGDMSCAIKNNFTPYEILSHVKNYDEIAESISDLDVLLVNGGGYFNQLWSMSHRISKLIQIMVPIIIANNLNKKIVFTANGYGPFGDSSEFFLCFFNSLNNTTFYCRDNLYSPAWMMQVGINYESLRFIPDDLMLINESILQKKKSISISSKRYILLETYLPVGYLEQNIDSFKDFSEYFSSKHDLSIVFMPLNIGHGGMDQAQFLARQLDNFEYCDISTTGYLSIQDAVSIIDKAELVISNRYHALVLALQCATPVISVLKDVLGDKRYYYNKNKGVLSQVLNGVSLDESLYLTSSFQNVFEQLKMNYTDIVQKQLLNYETVHSTNMVALNTQRNDFINGLKLVCGD